MGAGVGAGAVVNAEAIGEMGVIADAVFICSTIVADTVAVAVAGAVAVLIGGTILAVTVAVAGVVESEQVEEKVDHDSECERRKPQAGGNPADPRVIRRREVRDGASQREQEDVVQ